MNKQLLQAIYLAWRDWKYEHLMTLCAILALASMLTPILVLQGLKNGVVEGMRSRLLEDPAVLIITPKSDAGHFSDAFIRELAALPGAGYAIGRIRETATDITLTNPQSGIRVSIGLEPATTGEPVLSRYSAVIPENSTQPGLVLSATAAQALKVEAGGTLKASLGRRTPSGKLESADLTFRVLAVLPREAADRKMAFAPLATMADMENYRDYIAVPDRGWEGRELESPRDYASFRLYAKSLNHVESLAAWLEDKKIEVITSAREIAGIRLLESSINEVILIISLAVGTGFVAFTVSSVQSAVSRKQKMLGMLRLLGFFRLPLMLYPLTQTVLTALAGFILSLGVYLCVGFAIQKAFESNSSLSTLLYGADIALIGGAVLLLSILACLRGAIHAAQVEPSIVIREV